MGKIDLEAIKRKLASMQGSNSNSRVQLWKPGIGEHKVRGLPWPDEKLDDGTPFVERGFYYLGNNAGIMAPAQFGKPDPIDALRQKLFKTGNPSDRELAKKLFARTRFYMPVIDRADKSSGVMVWAFGKLVYQRLLGFFLNDEIGDYLDIEDGFDLKVSISKQPGKRFNDTNVDVARSSSPAAVSPEEMKALLDAVPNIDDMYRIKGEDEIQTTLNSWLSGETDDGTDGTSRGKPKADELDKLAAEVQGDAKEIKAEEPKKESKPKKKKAAKKAKAEPAMAPGGDDPPKLDDTKTQSLDEAFDELMGDEDSTE